MFNDVLFENNAAVYVIKWRTIVQPGRQQITIWRVRIACWIPKATNTHSEYVNIYFPLQKWLHERILFLRDTTLSGLFSSGLLFVNR